MIDTTALRETATELVRTPDLKGALRTLRTATVQGGYSLAVYRTNDRGLELLLGVRDGEAWSRLPATLAVVPAALDRLRNGPPGLTAVIPPEDSEIPELTGHTAVALPAEGRTAGFLLINKAVAAGDAHLLELVAALLGARIRASRDALEIRRLREERYEHLVKTETLAATGMLSAGVAHELNNPLGVVLGLAEILMLDDDIPERIRADARVIAEETSRAVSVVRQLLSYAPGGGLHLEPADVLEHLESSDPIFETAHNDPPIDVTRDYADTKFMVLGDPFRLQQAFLAILDNARKAVLSNTRQGRVAISVQAAPAGRVAIRFTDNGPGVEPSIQTRIFDPFFTTRELGSGTGMGLALVQRTLMDHQGEIRLETPTGGGASFIIELDLYEA